MKTKTGLDLRILILITAVALFAIHCGSNKSPSAPDLNVDENIARGWSLFEQSPPDYEGALIEFSQAILLNPESVEAYTGRGWTYSRLAFGPGDINYVLAKDNFNEAIERNATPFDALAGLAFVELVLNEYESAIEKAKEVIEGDPEYVFAHDTDITVTELKLILGHAYFFLGDYLQVITILIELQPGEFHPIDKPEVLLAQLQELWGNSLN